MRPLSIAALIASAGWLAVAPITVAQVQMPDQRPAAAFSEQKLDAAAAAIQQMAGLRQSYQQRMADAGPAEQQRIAAETGVAVRKAVTDHGLSVTEYNQILETAQKDPDLRDKLVQRLHLPEE